MFEIEDRDICGRVGRITLGGKKLTTPAFLPVIDPRRPSISAGEMRTKFGIEAVFTNAYLIFKNPELREVALSQGVHRLLAFDGLIATDSGAYQGYLYGKVDVEPEEIERFQEEIGADMAVILDLPVRLDAPFDEAQRNVLDTLERARKNMTRRKRRDLIWFGPIHGARYLNLVEQSAREMAKLDFGVFAIGSVVEALNAYQFELHVDIILSAKRFLPPNKPLHVFGVGHPMFFAIPVALGCDLFDSASYALFAREGRYITEYGTIKLDILEHFPCSCEVCLDYTPREVKNLAEQDREELLARHNLYACISEINRIRQAIVEGRLWELIELRARSHPLLLNALKRLMVYRRYLERFCPIVKRRGIFYVGATGLARPEIVRHELRMEHNYRKPEGKEILVLIPQILGQTPHRSWQFRKLRRALSREIATSALSKVHFCVYAAPFGVIPIELDEVYPLSQIERSWLDSETINYVKRCLRRYLELNPYNLVIFHNDPATWSIELLKACEEICNDLRIPFTSSTQEPDPWNGQAIADLVRAIKRALHA